MTKLLPLTLISAVCCMQVSCSQLWRQDAASANPHKAEKELKTPAPLHLGAVHQVYRNFALLRIIGPMPQEGTVLISYPMDGTMERMGNLVVSSAQHRRGNIIAADIRSGWVMKGDRVFLYRGISEQNEEEGITPEPTEETPLPDIPEPGPDTMPDFNSIPVITPSGTNPLDTWIKTAPSTDTEPEPVTTPEPLRPESEETPAPEEDILPSGKLDDIPDTLDGWN